MRGDEAVQGLPTALVPMGVAGVDAGMTLTKVVVTVDGALHASATETDGARPDAAVDAATRLGVTGACVGPLATRGGATIVQEIDAAARGARALLADGGGAPFVLALLGTGTAFAHVADGRARHLGGTPLGGGSFAGIARRIAPALTHDELIACAARGDRRRADVMISDVYPGGIGRIGPELTAAHMSKRDGAASLDDVLASLLNLHAENLAQIAASRALIAGVPRLVLAGGFAQDNHTFAGALSAMAKLFGVAVEAIPAPGYAGAIGAALIAAEAAA